MCVTPRTIFVSVGGQFREYVVACRKCWQCKADRVWDWVGRAIAENESATKSFFVTLTYGQTDRYGEALDDRARALHYPDVQKWLKRIRWSHDVRYVVTGEYGSFKGRAHWHALLFFRGSVPDVKVDYRYWGNRPFNSDPFWTDGHTMWREFDPSHAKYVCKYMLKQEDKALTRAALSKRPPLGHDYFMARAERFVDQGLSPQDLVYSFPEVTYGKKNREPRKFVLQGVSRENFLSHFVQAWRKRHGRDSWPYSSPVEEWLDEESRPAMDELRLDLKLGGKREVPHVLERPWYVPEGYGLAVDKRLNLWTCSHPSVGELSKLYWAFDENGFSRWLAVPNLVTEAEARALREAFASRQQPPDFDPRPAAVRRRGR